MSDQQVIKAGPFLSLGTALAFLFFASLWIFAKFFDDSPDNQDVMPFLTFLLAAISLRLGYLLYCYASGRVIAILDPQGLKARSCDYALVPWDLVSKVTRVEVTASMLASDILTLLIQRTTRHDAYEVVLDKKVLEMGVKHGEFLTQTGFTLEPLKLTISSRELAALFRRYLPPERCVDFSAEQGS